MIFQSPWVLYGLLALSIPIIIHLFNFRKYKVIYFTQVQFLKELQEQTASTKKLKHLLILLLRLLAVASLVIAFAQPFIPSNTSDANQPKALAIYIDNSFSMQKLGKGTTLLEEAKNFSEDIAKACHPKTKFYLLTNDFEGRHQHLLHRDQFIDYVKQIRYSSEIKSFNQVEQRRHQFFTDQITKQSSIYYLSDFQKSTAQIEQLQPLKSQSYWLPLKAEVSSNVSLDTCWFEQPFHSINSPNTLFVRAHNHSSSATSVTLKLIVDGVQKSVQTVGLEADSSTDVGINFSIQTGGFHKGTVMVNDHPIQFDNQLFFNFKVADAIKVASIYENVSSNRYVDALFEDDELFNYESFSSGGINYNELNQNAILVLNGLQSISTGLAQRLEEFVKQGGSLVIFPALNSDISSYNALLNRLELGGYSDLKAFSGRVTQLNYSHPLLDGVFEHIPKDNIDLPTTKAYYPLSASSGASGLPIMTLSNGQVLWSSYATSGGRVYLSGVGLSDGFSNLYTHALFVPTLYKMALQSGSRSPLFYTLGRNQAILLDASIDIGADEVLHLVSEDGSVDVIPERVERNGVSYLYVHDQIQKAGQYVLNYNDAPLQVISFNYNPVESEVETYAPNVLEELAKEKNSTIIDLQRTNPSELVKNMEEGVALWKYFIGAVLVFLALEQLVSRLWKHS